MRARAQIAFFYTTRPFFCCYPDFHAFQECRPDSELYDDEVIAFGEAAFLK